MISTKKEISAVAKGVITTYDTEDLETSLIITDDVKDEPNLTMKAFVIYADNIFDTLEMKSS